eukprot:scaffold3411_cov396-Prasinococcus_capsulatus_cf.AAC.4
MAGFLKMYVISISPVLGSLGFSTSFSSLSLASLSSSSADFSIGGFGSGRPTSCARPNVPALLTCAPGCGGYAGATYRGLVPDRDEGHNTRNNTDDAWYCHRCAPTVELDKGSGQDRD